MGLLFKIKKNRSHRINNGVRFYTIKILWRDVKIRDIHIGYGVDIIKTLKFRHKKDAEKALKKIKFGYFFKPISWRNLLDIDYF